MSRRDPTLVAGRYHLEARLGAGGMGEVRAAVDEALDRPVAIKFLRPALADDAPLRARFEREARAAARVAHPNVVTVFDVGEHDDVPFIVMEQLSGRTLADELADGALAAPRVRTLGLEVLGAVAAAHRLGVIHRDLKPANILLTDDGHAKVADFGIAKVAEDASATTTGLGFGTAAYTAPERLRGEPATPASDVYAVGVVLFEALTGRAAFRADTPLALAALVAEGRAPFRPEDRATREPVLVDVVERAMAPDPAERFGTAAEMAAALGAPAGALTAAPTLPMDPGPLPTQPIAPVSAPHARAGEIVTVPPTVADDSVTAADLPPAPTGRRARRGLVAGAALLLVAALVVVTVILVGPDSSPPVPTSSPSPTAAAPASGDSTPPPLRDAIDRLDAAVDR